MNFNNSSINLNALKKKAYNNRWADSYDGVIPLTAADPDFPVAPEIIDGIADYINDGYLNYGPFTGLTEFKETVASYFNNKHGCQFSAEDVLPVNSAAKGMQLVAKFLLDPGDEAIIFDPVDFLFQSTIKSIGAAPVPMKLNMNGEVDFNLLEQMITAKTKMICLCNPHNPLGKVYSTETLKKIADLAIAHNIWVMSDEIWSDIIYDEKTHNSFSTISENAALKSFTIYGFSKSYGLAGLRVGAVFCSNKEKMSDFIKKSDYYTTIEGVSTISQIAAIVAINKAQYWLEEFKRHLHTNRSLVFGLINQTEILEAKLPESTYVIFPKIKNGMSSDQFINQLMEKGKVKVVPGNTRWFGNEAKGHIRICFSTSEEILKEAFERMVIAF